MTVRIKNFAVFILIVMLFSGFSCNKEKTEFSQEYLEIPQTNGNQIIQRAGYSLSYNEKHEQADWVAYVLTKEEAESDLAERTDDFREDPDIITGSATPDDYKSSGFDRGHLAPAGDMTWSELAMSESFYMSNMSPQNPSLNRGKWNSLESQVREWAIKYGELFIVTGGVLKDGLPVIGQNQVSVPEFYYKVILDNTNKKAIGFLMENKSLDQDIFYYAVEIDRIEIETGIDFFYRLDDQTENALESSFQITDWN